MSVANMRFDRLSADDLPWLLSDGHERRLSVYLPLAAPGEKAQVNAIRLKNALREADSQLSGAGLDKRERAPYLTTLRSLDSARDRTAWGGAAGLCAFSDGNDLELRTSPAPWDEVVTVGTHYQVLPAIPFCQPRSSAFVLALSLNRARLLTVTRFDAEESPLPDETPKSFAEAVGREREEQHLQFHSSGGSGNAPVYHGQGGGKDDVEPELEEFCRRVARGVDARMRGNPGSRLILAADVQLTPIYRRQAPHEIAGTIAGNFDHASAADIREQVAALLDDLDHRDIGELRARYDSVNARDGGSDDEEDLLIAARAGRISELLVKAELSPIRLADAMKPADHVGSLTSIATLRHGGKVSLVPPRDFPSEAGNLAGIYRY